MKPCRFLLGFLLLVATALVAHAQVIYTWHGTNDSFDYFDGSNWTPTAPVDDIVNTQLHFGPATSTHLRYYQIYVNGLTFSGITKSYWLEGDYDTTHIGTGGIVYAPSGSVQSRISGGIQLDASQTWDIQGGTLITDYIHDLGSNFTLTKTGAGTLVLASGSDWTGGFMLNAGTVQTAGNYYSSTTPFGTGLLSLNGGTLVATHDIVPDYQDELYISNDVTTTGTVNTINYVPVYFNGSTFTLQGNTVVNTSGRFLEIDADIGETGGSRSLTMNGTGTLVLVGSNTYTGGTTVNNGALIFATVQSIPAAPTANILSVAANSYVGLGDDQIGSYSVQTDFLNRFVKSAALGTIGFDTDPSLSTTNFSDNLDLTGFAGGARLGSATSAILSGTITPQGTDYQFGGGGGFLQVDSQLTGARGLVVNSPVDRPLLLRLTNFANDFTGNITVANSGVVFSDTALPARTITIGTGGYVGTESANSGSPSPDDSDIAYFLARIATNSVGMIGFDDLSYYPYSSRSLNRDVDLGNFTGALYFGTSTVGYTDDGIYGGLDVTGTILTTNHGADPYRFAGYKGGLLEIESTLTGPNGVIIGDPNSPGTFGDPISGNLSTVFLNGNNSGLTGNITLYGGILAIGQVNGTAGTNPTTALGSGTVVVQGMSLPSSWLFDSYYQYPAIWGDQYQTIVPNNFQLNTTLRIADYSNWLQLGGKVSGTGGIYLGESSTLALLNDTNDFTGGIYLGPYSELHIGADHATGGNVLGFGGGAYSNVVLDSLTPTIAGLQSNATTDFTNITASLTNTILTINQAVDTTFRGDFESGQGSTTDNFRVVKTGAGTLDLDYGGFYNYNGTTEATLPASPLISLQVNQGTVILGENFYFANSASQGVWVHGGTLVLRQNNYILSDVYVDNGGRLQGSGAIYANTLLSPTAIISPGVAGATQVGVLTFNDLTLMGGATLEVTLRDPNGTAGSGWDYVGITDYSYTLHIDPSVTPATPFTIKLVSLDANGNPGTAVGFLNQSYYWTVFDATNSSIDFGSGSFNPAAFVIDSSQFSADIGPGAFTFIQSGNLLQVTFTPVPEPSTYALLGVGLGTLALGWRRRRARQV